jgi:hypothetical protein
MRRWIIILLVSVLALAGAAGFWLLAQPTAAAYVVPGATSVRVREVGLGERYITYDAPSGYYDWYFAIADRLEHAGWIPPDKWGPADQLNTYTHVAPLWRAYGGYLWEQVELHGEPRQARITVRRWFRFPWRQYLGNFHICFGGTRGLFCRPRAPRFT